MVDHSADPQPVRTIRTAVRLGDETVTLEASLTLPLDADDVQLQRAIELSRRLSATQIAALEQQLQRLRDQAAPARERDPAASARQRNYIAALQDDHGWTAAQLDDFARRQGFELAALTRRQAVALIDALRRSADVHDAPPAEPRRPLQPRQRHALERVAAQRGIDLAAEILTRFGCTPDQIGADQAAQLLLQWQAAVPRGRTGGSGRS